VKFRLKGKSRHGKNRVKQHGDLWRAVKSANNDFSKTFEMFFSVGPSPWILLESIDCKCSTCNKWGQDSRWVSKRNDKNFEVIEDIN
jgi:hypothetical protein